MLVLLSLRLSMFNMVMSTPDRSLLFGRRGMGPPRLQLVLGCVPAETAWETQVHLGMTTQVLGPETKPNQTMTSLVTVTHPCPAMSKG